MEDSMNMVLAAIQPRKSDDKISALTEKDSM